MNVWNFADIKIKGKIKGMPKPIKEKENQGGKI